MFHKEPTARITAAQMITEIEANDKRRRAGLTNSAEAALEILRHLGQTWVHAGNPDDMRAFRSLVAADLAVIVDQDENGFYFEALS